MTLWIVLAVVTAVALIALLRPLGRGDGAGGVDRPDYDMAVYRDQLAELDREAARGLIGKQEAEAARNEIARRMLAADAAGQAAPQRRGATHAYKAAVAAAIVAIPAVAMGGYLWLGRPGMPDVPHAARMATALERQDFQALIYRVERHLADNPEDARGWTVLAPAYKRLGRYQDAAEAYARAVALKPGDAELLSDYGETLVLAADGLVTAEARDAFAQALEIAAEQVRARYYMGVAAYQDGDTETALQRWRALLADTPEDAPWRQALAERIATAESEQGLAAAPGGDAAEAVAEASPEERQAMIEGMVDGLAARLARDGDDLEGWLRLARARAVLGEKAAAREALKQASARFAGDEAARRRIEAMRESLGLDG